MAILYFNFDKNYDKMIDFMHKLLEVRGKVIPVTTKKARIRAILWNGDIIESQDRISNVAEYSAGIADLELSDCSTNASYHSAVHETIIKSDYILVWPWDLFTSLISNFIIWWVRESIKESNAKIIYIWNNTNKWWETSGFTQLDCFNKIERLLWKKIDYFVVNNWKLSLNQEETIIFQNNESVKWGDFLYLSTWERVDLENRWVTIVEDNLLDPVSYYKHDKKNIVRVLKNITSL